MAIDLAKLKKKAKASKKEKTTSKKVNLDSLFGGKKKKKSSKDSDEPVFAVSKGYKSVQQNAERIKKQQELGKTRLYRWFIGAGESSNIRFVTGEPITFYEHTFFNEGSGNPPENHTCTKDTGHCKHCKTNKPTFKGAYVVIDRRKYKIKNGPNAGKTVKNTPKLLVCGQTMLAQLEHQHKKYDLTTRDFEVTRTGKGKSTSYAFDRGEKSKLSKEDKETIAKLCGEKDIDEVIIDNIKPEIEEEEQEDEDYDESAVSKKLRKFGIK